MPPLAPDFSNRLLIGAPCPIDKLRAGDKLAEHGNRVGVMIAKCLRDVRDAVANFDGRNLFDETRRAHAIPLTRPVSHSAEQHRLAELHADSQAADATIPVVLRGVGK